MKEDMIFKRSALYRWQNKRIQKRVSIFSYLENPVIIKNPYNNKDSAVLKACTDVPATYPRPTVKYLLPLNLDAQDYNRLKVKIYIDAPNYPNFYLHISAVTKDGWCDDAPSITPNKEEEILWELKDLDLSLLKEIKITIFMMGTPPEAKSDITIYLEDVILEKVVLDEDYGWCATSNIIYSHIGYLPSANKQAIIWNPTATTFKLVYKGEVIKEAPLSKEVFDHKTYGVIDFSDVIKEGTYYIQVGDKKTHPFKISNEIYQSSINKSIAFLESLRCGVDVKGVHSACHLNCYTINEKGESVPNYGGWHDAGDVSQFEICTAEMAYAILELASVEKDASLRKQLLEEARVGIDWLLRTRLSDGKRALAVGYHIWRSNQKAEGDKTLESHAEEGPFECFLAAMALARAALIFEKSDAGYASWCKRIAILDYQHAIYCYDHGIYTKRWGPSITSLVSGAACSALCLLYQLTKDERYLSDATRFSRSLLNCQEQDGVSGIKGFFYEDEEHNYVLTFEHRGHEQTPIEGLVNLCKTFKDHPMLQEWLNGVELYATYIKDSYINNPYGLMSAQIYLLNKMRDDRFTVPSWYCTPEEAHNGLRRQVKCGKKLDDNTYLRMFPIAIQRRGFHATLLSKTKGIAMCANLLKNEALKRVVLRQIEWVMGMNPFNASTMYGEGYNYHPLYVAFSPQLVGSLPVGIMTKEDEDLPYWPQATQAVYKEVWGHTTGKYLGILKEIKEGLDE